MKRIALAVIMLVLANLLSGTGLAQSSTRGYKPPRSEDHVYNASRGGNAGAQETNMQDLIFSPLKNERYVHLTTDDSYNNDEVIALTVTQDPDGDGDPEHEYAVCGKTEDPLAIHGSADIKVRVETVGCGGALGGTTGQVEMLFFSTKKQVTQWSAAVSAPALDPDEVPGERRTLDASYSGGGVGVAGVDTTFYYLETGEGEALGGAVFRAGPTERFVSIDIVDDSGLPTRAQISLSDGAAGKTIAVICGRSETLIPIEPGSEVNVETSSGACPDGSPAAATQGTVTATFVAP